MHEAVGHPLSAPPHHHTLSLSEFALISPHWSALLGIAAFLQGVRRGYGILDNVVVVVGSHEHPEPFISCHSLAFLLQVSDLL